MTVRVTVEDLETGKSESQEVDDDYIIVTAGSCYVAHTNVYPQKGTHVVTVKGRGGLESDRSGSIADGPEA